MRCASSNGKRGKWPTHLRLPFFKPFFPTTRHATFEPISLENRLSVTATFIGTSFFASTGARFFSIWTVFCLRGFALVLLLLSLAGVWTLAGLTSLAGFWIITGLSGSCLVREEFSSPLPPPSPDESSVLFSSIDPLPFAVSSWSSSFSRDNLVLKYKQAENQTKIVTWSMEGHLGTVTVNITELKTKFSQHSPFGKWLSELTRPVKFSLAQKDTSPSPKKFPQWFSIHKPNGFFFSVSRNQGHPACHFVLNFLVLVHFRDSSYGSQTDFTD